MKELFLWIFRDFMGFIWQLKTQVLNPDFSLPGSGGRPD